MSYTLEEIETKEDIKKVREFLVEAVRELLASYRVGFKPEMFSFHKDHRLVVCRRDGIPVGFMLSRLTYSILDPSVRILYQDILYAKSRTRAAKYLMDDFIDFGKTHANHVISMIAEHTNVKPRSLERLGFKKIETLYRMEISR